MIFLHGTRNLKLRHWLLSANLNVNTVHTFIIQDVFIVASPIKHKKAVLSQAEPCDPLSIRIEFHNNSIMERLCTLNTASLSRRTHLAPKPAQNTLHHL